MLTYMLSLTPLRNRYYFIGDAIALLVTPLIALWLRFENFSWVETHATLVLAYILPLMVGRLAIGSLFHMYRRLWHHASGLDIKYIVGTSAASGMLALIWGYSILPIALPQSAARFPLSAILLDSLLFSVALVLPRALARSGVLRDRGKRKKGTKPAIIVGAGQTGKIIAKELLTNPESQLCPVAFLDDDTTIHGKRLYNLPVEGSIEMLPGILKKLKIKDVVIAIPSAAGQVIRQIVRASTESGAYTHTVPSLTEILAQPSSATTLREVRIEDLLRRAPIQTDLKAVSRLVTDQTVLVTGAGGSIGSELCRQIARLAPARLILLGHGENSIFETLHELRKMVPDVPVIPVIADIRNRERIMKIFSDYNPFSVFHAAAHKHVPLMEENVAEAITNNVSGTRNVVQASAINGARHFVLISSDKAVRPTSVMGATKRVAEQIVQTAAEEYGLNFVSVRFGNVLGSRGSVVPTFLRQIRSGGPVTVTHPEMRRYFMTIPEAVQLVLQAGAIGYGGEVFVLDMGDPIRIVDLASDIIRLSGLEVGADVEIQYTGMRPGEKMYEEMFFSSESASPTGHEKILRARAVEVSPKAMERIEAMLEIAWHSGNPRQLRSILHEIVPGYTNGDADVTLGEARVTPLWSPHPVKKDGPKVTATPPPSTQIAAAMSTTREMRTPRGANI